MTQRKLEHEKYKRVNACIDPLLHKQALLADIQWSEAIKLGIMFKLGKMDKQILITKINETQSTIEEKQTEIRLLNSEICELKQKLAMQQLSELRSLISVCF